MASALAVIVVAFIFADASMTPALTKMRALENQELNPEDVADFSGNYIFILRLLPWSAVAFLAIFVGNGLFESWKFLRFQIEECSWVDRVRPSEGSSSRKGHTPRGKEFSQLSPGERRHLPELIAFSATSNLHQIVMPNLEQMKHLLDQWEAYVCKANEAFKPGDPEERKSLIKSTIDSKARLILERMFSEADWLNDDVRRLWREEGFLSSSEQSAWSIDLLQELMASVIIEVEKRNEILKVTHHELSEENVAAFEPPTTDHSAGRIAFTEKRAFPTGFFFSTRDDVIRGILEEAYRNARHSGGSLENVQITFHYSYPVVWVGIMNRLDAGKPHSTKNGDAMSPGSNDSVPVVKASMGMGSYFMKLAATLGGISVTHLSPGLENCHEVVFVGYWISHIGAPSPTPREMESPVSEAVS